MKPQRKPEVIELDADQLETQLDQIEQVMGEQMARPFRQLLGWYLALLQLIEQKNTTLGRLRRLLFGPRTERSRDVQRRAEDGGGPTPEAADQASGDSPELSTATPPNGGGNTDGEPDDGSSAASPDAKGRRRRPNHGRIPAQAYVGCEQVVVTHPSLAPGDFCPHCQEGTLCRLNAWAQVVRLKGHAPVSGTRYVLERLRCSLCGKLEKAELPAEAGPDKYDPTVASIVAMLRYGQGLPWNRIQQLQRSAGIPLPASVQWELVRDAVSCGPGNVYQWLLVEAAQGNLLHNDDTRMQILELTGKLKNNEPVHEDDPQRRGVFTTNILSVAEGRPTISLFFTGTRHAGENLSDVLVRRMTDLPPPVQMCDALSRNLPGNLKTIVANCLSHGRRNFFDLADIFPSQVGHVLRCLGIVYRVDGRAKHQGLSPDERLRLHQARSGPVMQHLREWFQRQFDERQVEPNSSLGKSITYMLKHWEKLTLFLRVAGAPLDNNICERALKMAICHRKNSLFYKTLRGADVGDLYMSLIHTCYHAQADPFDYLTQLQRHSGRVAVSPGEWLPWNYRQQLTSAATAEAAVGH